MVKALARAMEPEGKQERTSEAIGQMLGLSPELLTLKEEVTKRLEQGESEEAVQAWFVEAVSDRTNPLEHAFGMDAMLAEWVIKFASTGEPEAMFGSSEGGVWGPRNRPSRRTFPHGGRDGWTLQRPSGGPEGLQESLRQSISRHASPEIQEP